MTKAFCQTALGLLFAIAFGASRVDADDYSPLGGMLEEQLDAGAIVGAQLVVGRAGAVLYEKYVGTLAPGDEKVVNADTLFCIGSCSKPLASATIMTLVDGDLFDLDDAIDRWLPEFKACALVDGGVATRAPTIRELLAHRAGIFSQKRRLTPQQAKLIRDFSLTLAESVDGIARQPLLAEPGTEFAYSGAGYCVAGRVAEVASGHDFQTLFKRRLLEPLGMPRTCYFPADGDENVAAGGVKQGEALVPNSETPHRYGSDYHLALIGGSVYSTAREHARFAAAMAAEGRLDSGELVTRESFLAMTTNESGPVEYGLGWRLIYAEGEADASTARPIRIGHGGSLASSRALIEIDFDSDLYCTAHWTLADALAPDAATNAIHRAVGAAVFGEPLEPTDASEPNGRNANN